jgi:predicted transcriptional regulator
MKKILKPKDLAARLGIAPALVSIYAKEIENDRIHYFKHTALGSYHFTEEDFLHLREYHKLKRFFIKREPTLMMFKEYVEKYKEKRKRPLWTKMLKNAKWI